MTGETGVEGRLPLISVIMCVYNETNDMIMDAVQSVINQTYENWELILVCDRPDDFELHSFLKSLQSENIRVYSNEKNMGAALSRNFGVEKSQGEFIAVLDADDICEPERLMHEMKYLREGAYDIVCAGRSFINEKGEAIEKEDEVNTEQEVLQNLLYKNYITHSTVLMKKGVFTRFGGYKCACAQDYGLWLRVYKAGGKIGYLSEKLVKYRIRENSLSARQACLQALNSAYFRRLYKKSKSPEDFSEEAYSRFCFRYHIENEKVIQRYERSVQDRRKFGEYLKKKKYLSAVKAYICAVCGSKIYRLNIYNSIEYKMKKIIWKNTGKGILC